MYCFTMILSHFGDVMCGCVTHITVELTPQWPPNGHKKKVAIYGEAGGVI